MAQWEYLLLRGEDIEFSREQPAEVIAALFGPYAKVKDARHLQVKISQVDVAGRLGWLGWELVTYSQSDREARPHLMFKRPLDP